MQMAKRHNWLAARVLPIAIILACAMALTSAFVLGGCASPTDDQAIKAPLSLSDKDVSDPLLPQPQAEEQPQAEAPVEPQPTQVSEESLSSFYNAIPLPDEMRAMWISYLEWQHVDFSSEASAQKDIATMFENSKNMGINTVIVHVRPFSDAFYRSELFPFSHFMGGSQGHDPGFDPLVIMIEEAHKRGLRVEAWLNPYRVDNNKVGLGTLSADNPARQHPDWVMKVAGGLWYDPGLPQVRDLVRDGVLEIVENYQVDGIHFDDYFYPDVDAWENSFDADTFARYGGNMSLSDWRRANVDKLVSAVYEGIKAINPSVSFGISPQGNNENNYSRQYCDIKKWMATPGFVDYVMPQLYWGFAYRTPSGNNQYAFKNVAAEWAGYPRVDSVRLYAGLGAYRLGVAQGGGGRSGFGDGGSNSQAEWESGHNLADMVVALRAQDGFSGFALFRYDSLFQGDDALSKNERAALSKALQ